MPPGPCLSGPLPHGRDPSGIVFRDMWHHMAACKWKASGNILQSDTGHARAAETAHGQHVDRPKVHVRSFQAPKLLHVELHVTLEANESSVVILLVRVERVVTG